MNDSEGDEGCGRGALQLTYRQGLSLGMSLQADAFVSKDYERVADSKQERESLLESTVTAAGEAGLPDDSFSTELAPPSRA